MASIRADVHRRGCIAATHELLRDGHTSHQLTNAVRRAEVFRVRQGHYACPDLDELQTQAFRVGGRLTGVAGASAHGLWVPRWDRVDIQVPADARALRTRTDPAKRLIENRDPLTHVAWTDRRAQGTRSLAGPLECLALVVQTCEARTAFAVAESALHLDVITRREWQRMLTDAPNAKARRLGIAGRLSESGGESLLRFDLHRGRIPVRQQIRVPGVGRVDLLIGERLIIEVDGAQFHTERPDFEEDRRRDAAASVRGYRTLRFSYAQIERRDPLVLGAIRAAVGRGDHG